MSKTAILIDGGFYQKRMNAILGPRTPEERADELFTYCRRHLTESYYSDKHRCEHDLYRIFYYDCRPYDGVAFMPLTQKNINLKNTDQYAWMTQFLDLLYSKRKVAVRLGRLSQNPQYTLKYSSLKKLMNGTITQSELTEQDFILNITQKGVDTKIGLDITTMTLKKQVDQIVLISGDSDFVPAAKLARREGIDFILDPLNFSIANDLFEHIDGKRTCLSRDEIQNRRLSKGKHTNKRE